MFLANDPHNGGGLHPQDVMVQRPIFLGEQLIAWVVMSAHMMDVGGMVAGSFAPAATECYQEALRLPPVRLFRGGVEEADVWAIIRNNIRLAELVEMDLRSLVAGCHVAAEKIVDVLEAMGADAFVEGIRTIRDLTEAEMRRRIGELTEGVYRAESWAEWDDEFFRIPCRLTVEGGSLVFDFEGASPQTDHFFNSKPYIIESEMVAMLAGIIARDLPFNDGIFAPIELRCPEGTIVNARPPAPIAAAHMDVAPERVRGRPGMRAPRAGGIAGRARPAVGSPAGDPDLRSACTRGREPASTATPTRSSCSTATGSGAPPAPTATGSRSRAGIVGRESGYSFTDIEILESWYPILVSEKRARPGEYGAGQPPRRWRQHDGLPAARHRQAHRCDARHAPVASVARRRRRNARCLHRVRRAPRRRRERGSAHARVGRRARARRHLRVPVRVRWRVRRCRSTATRLTSSPTSSGACSTPRSPNGSTASCWTATDCVDLVATATRRQEIARDRLARALRP